MKVMQVLGKIHGYFPRITNKVLQLSNNSVINEERFKSLYWQLVKDGRMLLSLREAYNLYYHTQQTSALGGAIAEFGVYKGGSAKLIAESNPECSLFLFDTFEGMPTTNKSIDHHNEGDFSDTSLTSVTHYVGATPNIVYCPGKFPESTRLVPPDLRFSFVHLDVDIYESTQTGLDYFYPRLLAGGAIISHDYNSIACPGVKKAFSEFATANRIQVIPLWDTQCLITKSHII